MIQQKEKICSSCGLFKKLFSKGRCKSCTQREDSKPLKRTEIKKKPYSIPKQSQKSREAKKEQSKIRTLFFDYMINKFNENPICSETGLFINNVTRWNVCHILPKRFYKSVECKEDNVILLCIDKHTEFDKYLDTLDFKSLEKNFPNSWPKVCKQIKKLLPLCKESGKLKILFEDYLINF